VNRPRVKICGITRLDDAELAVGLGASAIGFIFWPQSPRFIDPYRARAIARRLPPLVTVVGVFVNQASEYINAVASLVGLGAVQLHGDEPPAVAYALARPIIKAISGERMLETAEAWAPPALPLVDAYDPVLKGGTGRGADWQQAARLSRQRPIMLAGGLNADNIAAAISTVRPSAVDVSSGVERAPGIKDAEALNALFARLREVRVEAGETGVTR
jgi:phosphoribosylanthranilate isomerase